MASADGVTHRALIDIRHLPPARRERRPVLLWATQERLLSIGIDQQRIITLQLTRAREMQQASTEMASGEARPREVDNDAAVAC